MKGEHAEVSFVDGEIVIDARAIATGLGLDIAKVPELMREARLTSLYEKGLDDHAGQHRITFFHADRSFRLVIDNSGRVAERLTSAEGGLAQGAHVAK